MSESDVSASAAADNRFPSKDYPHMMSALGGGGSSLIADKRKGGCVTLYVTSGRGSKKVNILRTSYVDGPWGRSVRRAVQSRAPVN